MALRLIFMGTPAFAVPTLQAIVAGGHDIVAIYTRAPKPAGRGMAMKPSPIEDEAQQMKVAVHTPASLKGAGVQDTFRAHAADAAIVVAYGLILPSSILQATKFGCFNLHASLLPRWRGAAPINRAIMAGDRETGVTVMKMDEGLDTGAIAMTERVTIGADMTAGELHDALAKAGAGLMAQALEKLERGTLKFTAQSETGVTYAEKIDKAETRIDWTKPWQQVHDHIRGLSPFPGAWCELADVGRVKLLRSTRATGNGTPGTLLDDRLAIACGEGAVRVLELQRAGKQPMKADEFLRGTSVRTGGRLG
ncbi:MAG TPA: methionyl-tRNA formyltransferase [Xanthobacteraceae bacterium]|nr:methionyl-tRNA formyltransferase [Xanthobacteraceae bacterium]